MFPGMDKPYSMSFAYYLKAYKYYTNHYEIEENEDAFYDYISEIMVGRPIETAFINAAGKVEFDKALENGEFGNPMDYIYDDMWEQDYERNRSFEEMADEQDRWALMERFDDDFDYDPENVAFNEYDKELDEW